MDNCLSLKLKLANRGFVVRVYDDDATSVGPTVGLALGQPIHHAVLSIVEATQALGCAISVGLAVQVKREIGALWANTAAAPYSEIFSDGLSTTWLWRSVLVMRSVDEEIHKLRSSPNVPRADVVGVHLNRIILHLVFQDPEVKKLSHDGSLEGELIAAARKAAHRLFPLVAEYLQEKHDGEYLASLCKNSSKCEPLVKSILAAPKAAPLVQQQMDLS